MGKFSDFNNARHRIPGKTLAWRIYGKGMENFGDDWGREAPDPKAAGRKSPGAKAPGSKTSPPGNKIPVELPVPEPKDDELLVRNDAVGLCFSDTKIIKFGSEHPRITGRDLKKDPVIPGHEVAVTVIKAGRQRAKDYKPGQRFIVQADAFYKGKATSYGYILPGGLTQYGIITREILDGDAGSYLIPIENDKVGYSEVALVEPWACVVAAYRIVHRRGLKAGGVALVIGGKGHEERDWQFERLFKAGSRPKAAGSEGGGSAGPGGAANPALEAGEPATVVLAGVGDRTKAKLEKAAAAAAAGTAAGSAGAGSAAPVKFVSGGGAVDGAAIKALLAAHTKKGFDDILVLGDAADDTVVSAADSMCADGIMNYMASSPAPQVVNVDAGKVHYDRIALVGSTGADPAAPYGVSVESGLKGESVIMFGAGGPMGQMHVQLVIEDKHPPKVLIATDIDKSRLDALRQKFAARAKARGIAYHVLNPNDFAAPKAAGAAGAGGPGGPDAGAFRKEILRLNGGRLFDYVVCLAAIPAVIEDSSTYLADGAVLNIFAGVSRGTIARLDVKDVAVKSVRFFGSSGSSLDDMVFTLRKVERGELDTDSAVAGVSGINDVWAGIEAVRTGSFPGKIVVYPHIANLDLTSLGDLAKAAPEAASRLASGGDWTREAEKALLDAKLDLE